MPNAGEKSFQDQGAVDDCFGCGPKNKDGYQIKTYWDGEGSVCRWMPEEKYMGGDSNVLYGGAIASLIDCNAINLAIAQKYKDEKRAIGSTPKVFVVSAQLNVALRKPVSLNKEVTVKSQIREKDGRKAWVDVKLFQNEEVCAEGEVLAIDVSDKMNHARATGG